MKNIGFNLKTEQHDQVCFNLFPVLPYHVTVFALIFTFILNKGRQFKC